MSNQWRTFDEKPVHDIAALTYRGNAKWHNAAGEITSLGPVRDCADKCGTAFFENGEWFESCTGHDLFEGYNPDWEPTHWMEIPEPPA